MRWKVNGIGNFNFFHRNIYYIVTFWPELDFIVIVTKVLRVGSTMTQFKKIFLFFALQHILEWHYHGHPSESLSEWPPPNHSLVYEGLIL